MHELAVCQALLDEVEAVAAANGAHAVLRIEVAIGPLSGVEAGLLARAFSIARLGGVAEHARLELDEMPILVHCPACGTDSDAAANRLLCAACGTWRVRLISGDELVLRRVELQTDEGVPARSGEEAACARNAAAR